MATRTGTWTYYHRFTEVFGRTFFRRFAPGVTASIGLGTYLGEPSDAEDQRYTDAITLGLESGTNHLDTAINYRGERSERVVGVALRRADVSRDEVIIATKGGFLPFRDGRPEDPGRYLQERFVEPGIVTPDDLARGIHCLDPEYLEWSLDRSLENLDLDTIDCYYVHNPETQLAVRSRDTVYDQLEAVFERLEARATAGDITSYGVATWEAFRVPPDHNAYLSLPTVVSRARKAAASVGNDATHFRAIQLPFNVHMADAFTVPAHDGPDGPVSALQFADEANLHVVTSASLLQGDLTEAAAIPAEVDEHLAGDSPAQRALNFARSAPGVNCALAGTRSRAHIAENLAAGTFDPMGARTFDALFE